eukprot:TRINITY_DN3407_c0_g1_i1.p1 TRINITY_DN3407_c0_g1~~TRINITY_DN3407_c0_g1_i1.p1  ORF type:complete len:691 (-),score=141.10 TRINITY_DN3407_c0_g1_i1:137-2209(-)
MATNGNGSNGVKRKGLLDSMGSDTFEHIKDKKIKAVDQEGRAKLDKVRELAADYVQDYRRISVPDDKPFVGAQPKLLKKPEIATQAQTARETAVACKTIAKLIEAAKDGVHIILAEDARHSKTTQHLLDSSTDEGTSEDSPVIVSFGLDWTVTLPFAEIPKRPQTKNRLLVYVGTPGKYLSMCIRSDRSRFDQAYKEDRLVVVCKGVCMLPLGTQEQNLFGVDEHAILDTISRSVQKKGTVFWGHGPGTKAAIMQKAYGYPMAQPTPKPLTFTGDAGGSTNSFDYLVEYIKYMNLVKIAKPTLPVKNWYDTGLLVSVLQGRIMQNNTSLLTDGDGLAMLRDASIGHIISKLNQMIAVEPFSTSKGVYNFFIGDGACRLNGGVELAMHLIEGYKAQSMTTLFIFNNHKWAIEDNLVAETEKEHHLFNGDFYNLIAQHGHVVVCENDLELRETIAFLSEKTDLYLQGKAKPGLSMVVVRGLDVEMPPVLGDISPIVQSSEMAFMRSVLAKFADGCHHKIPIYGCSAFEYIQYLHIFMEQMPEGKQFQYVCGRTDIQAAHMCGFQQPEGKCVLFINDVYGINSLGESLRQVLSGFGGKQLLIMIWHPSLMQLMDHFHLHRPPLVWPSLGQELCKYYVRKESDALFVDFEGSSSAQHVTSKVHEALGAGTPLVCVNVLPEQERDYASLDIRIKT